MEERQQIERRQIHRQQQQQQSLSHSVSVSSSVEHVPVVVPVRRATSNSPPTGTSVDLTASSVYPVSSSARDISLEATAGKNLMNDEVLMRVLQDFSVNSAKYPNSLYHSAPHYHQQQPLPPPVHHVPLNQIREEQQKMRVSSTPPIVAVISTSTGLVNGNNTMGVSHCPVSSAERQAAMRRSASLTNAVGYEAAVVAALQSQTHWTPTTTTLPDGVVQPTFSADHAISMTTASSPHRSMIRPPSGLTHSASSGQLRNIVATGGYMNGTGNANPNGGGNNVQHNR